MKQKKLKRVLPIILIVIMIVGSGRYDAYATQPLTDEMSANNVYNGSITNPDEYDLSEIELQIS